MKSTVRPHSSAGFGLSELITAVAVIGIMAAMAIPVLGGLWDRGESARDRRNAQTLISTFAAARSAGATFTVYTKTAVAEAISGNAGASPVRGRGVFATTEFRLALSAEELGNALQYVEAQGEGEGLVLSLKAP